MHRGIFSFITAIQDETHRFANVYRRQQYHKKAYASSLTQIPGIGPAAAKALLAEFKTVSAVREASAEQLQQAKGIGPAAAKAIFAHFHPDSPESGQE